MKTPKDFEYILWTTGNGAERKYWAKVKSTDEICEVDYEVMKFLRNEEKKKQRDKTQIDENGGSELYLNTLSDGETGEFWLKDPHNFEDEAIHKLMIREFEKQLTDKQLSVFRECLISGKTQSEYAKEHSLAASSVHRQIDLIHKKINIFLGICKKI